MTSLSDEYDRINDDAEQQLVGERTAEHGGAVTTTAGTLPGRPPPVATDFSRITTRYMIAAREWTRANRERALDALRRAVVEWTGYFHLTLWRWSDCRGNPRGGSADHPGRGVEYRTTIDRYATMLADNAHVLRPKGQLACVSLGRSMHAGSLDTECIARTGILLDSDDNGGWDGMRTLARSIGMAFAAQMRPVKPLSHHFEVPLARPWVPERDADGEVWRWKSEIYRPQLGWVMGILAELGELSYKLRWDEAGLATAANAGYDTMCDRLLQLNFIYHRRPEDPAGHVPVTDFAIGNALDVETLLELTDYLRAHEHLALATSPYVTSSRTPAAAKNKSAPGNRPRVSRGRFTQPVPGLEEMEEEIDRRISTVELLVRLRRLTNAEHRKLIELCLNGESYAPLKQRDTTMWKIACIVAPLAPNENPLQLAKLLFAKSLMTMAKLPGAEPRDTYVDTYLTLAARKFARAQREFGGGQ